MLESEVTPSVLDCHDVGVGREGVFVVLGFSGTYAEVDWQLSQAAPLGFGESCMLDHQRVFWDQALPPE